MLFNSYVFLFCFLPVTLTIYYFLNKYRKFDLSQAWLLLASLVFYAYFNISYLPIIIASIIINYFFTKLLYKEYKKGLKKFILILAIAFNISVFLYFKYYDFFLININAVFKTSFLLKNILLPLGLSFFTFQQISYVVDCYRGETGEYSFLYYASFVAFFPQLIAGPIVLHNEIVPQFLDKTKKKFNVQNFSKGIAAFAFGLAKKVLIADVFSEAVNFAFYNSNNINQLNTTSAIIAILSFTIQIYFDFSGYCDMATGIGLMFNINITQNFNSPYKAYTITDFWKRWHITLTRFFRRYVYFPLGGNKKGKLRTYINIFFVFVLSGFWHGANWTFVIWGALHGFFDILTKIFDKTVKRVPKVVCWLVTFALINFTWVFFRADSVNNAIYMIKRVLHLEFGAILPEISKNFIPPLVEFIAKDIFAMKYNIFTNILTPMFVVLYMLIAMYIILFTKNTNQKIAEFKPQIGNSLFVSLILIVSILSLTGIKIFLYFNF